MWRVHAGCKTCGESMQDARPVASVQDTCVRRQGKRLSRALGSLASVPQAKREACRALSRTCITHFVSAIFRLLSRTCIIHFVHPFRIPQQLCAHSCHVTTSTHSVVYQNQVVCVWVHVCLHAHSGLCLRYTTRDVDTHGVAVVGLVWTHHTSRRYPPAILRRH